MTKILIKKLSKEAIIPKYETSGSSGMDISANLDKEVEIFPGEKAIIPSGFSLSIPQGFEIQIRPRSGLAAKSGISVLNTPGTIDADYIGEIKIILINLSKEKFTVQNGMRIAQMIVSPVVQAKLEEVEELPKTSRGSGGFGSTGIK
tara:strand:+ start:66 stop:506 length:441 start_codon:yes stop_codon:yes gene_type:complete